MSCAESSGKAQGKERCLVVLLEEVRRHRLVAALRGVELEQIADTAQALYEGGIRLLEITFNQEDPERIPKTRALIEAVRERLGEKAGIGAGTVLTVEEVETAAAAGAEFLLAPNVEADVIARTKELGLGMVPGAFTPTEIADAYRLGADLVKVFPAGSLGLGYLKALQGPLGHIPLLPMGGVNEENLTEFLSVADGVGIGSSLVDLSLICQGNWEGLTALAKKYTTQL